ncbi:hypothetical protein ACSLMH_14555 [Flavobacterium columnare]|uniref:hypothetical protein n=1 Tax=Flavobacterium columnare TaxID=996 RepID=UPI003B9F953C
MISFKKDVLFSVAVQFLLLVFGLLLNKILSNTLSVEDFGNFNLIKRASTVVSFTMLAGMGIAIPRYLPLLKAKSEKYKYLATAFFIVISITFFFLVLISFFGHYFNEILFNGSVFINISFLYAFSITMLSFLFASFRGFEKSLNFNVSQLVIQFIVLILTFFYGYNVQEYVILSSVVSLLLVVVFFGFVFVIDKKQLFALNLTGAQTIIKELSWFGFPRMLGDFFLFSLHAVPLFLISKKFGIQQASMLTVAVTLTSMITPFFSYLGMVFLPKLSSLYGEGNIREIRRIVNLFLIAFIGISLVFTLGLLFFDNWLITLFFSSSYLKASEMIVVVSYSMIPNAIYLLLRNPIDVLSKVPYNTLNLILACTIGFIMMYYSTQMIHLLYAFVFIFVWLGVASYLIWLKLLKNEESK